MRRVLCECCVCGCNLYGADSGHYADTIYDFGGEYVCDDCLQQYADNHKINENTEDFGHDLQSNYGGRREKGVF